MFKGNQTRLLGIGRLFAESFIAQLGDFEYSEYMSHQTYGSADVAHTLSVIFSYKGIETKHHPFWSYENRSSYYYFPDWDLTIPAKLIKDAQKLTRLNNKNRTG